MRAELLEIQLDCTAEHSNALSLSAKKIINLEQSIKVNFALSVSNCLSLLSVLSIIASFIRARMILLL
jgi:hypothetical protein